MKKSIERLGEYKFLTTIIVVSILAIVFVVGRLVYTSDTNDDVVHDFKSCEAAGYPIMESYPRQCHANGQTYTEVIN